MTLQPRPTWVHPALLSASCIEVDADDAGLSDWLVAGTHLRVHPSAVVGLPLGPLTVWSAGRARPAGPTLPWGGDLHLAGTGTEAVVVGAWGQTGAQVSVLHADGRTTGPCSRHQPFVARVPLPGVRQRGPGGAWTATYEDGLQVDDEEGWAEIPAWLADEPLDALGAPLPDGIWWCGDDRRYPSADVTHRVQAGVPDTPLPYDGQQPADALGRAKVAAAGITADVEEAWSGDRWGPPPAVAPLARALDGHRSATARTTLGLALWASSVDPAVARWWGLGTTLPVEASIGGEESPCFAVAGLFVLPPTADEAIVALARVAQDDPMAGPVRQRLLEVHADRDLEGRVAALEDAGHEVVALWTTAVAARPPDQPEPPHLELPPEGRVWNDDGTWSATLAVHGAAGGPLAAQRLPDTPLNQPVLEGEAWRQPIVAPAAPDTPGAVSLTDPTCPEDPGEWRVATADMWGQWSGWADLAEVPPDQPPPPVPVLALEVEPGGGVAAGSAPASPAWLAVRVTLPPPLPGAPPTTSVRARLVGAASGPLIEHGEGRWSTSVPVDPTVPGGSVRVGCTVTARDAVGRQTEDSGSIEVFDPRPAEVTVRSGVVHLSGPRRPDGGAELDLRITRPPGVPRQATWRVYVADEQLLSPAPTSDEPRWSRARRLRAVVDAAGDRSRLARLTTAVVSDEGGELRLRAPLPGRLEAVHVLQLVATSPTGLESPSRATGSFAVAVPLGDAPPAPTLTAELADDRRTVRLVASVRYPGTRPGDGRPPHPVARRSGTAATRLRARIRRTATGGATGSPPVVATVDLVPDHPADPAAGWRWTAPVADVLGPATPAWSPLAYTCEVAWPDEPTWDPVATPDPGAVRPAWEPVGPRPGEWGPASAAVVVVAPRPRVAPVPQHRVEGDGTASITVVVPAAHPRARPWTLTATAPGEPVHQATGPGPTLRIAPLDASVAPGDWLVALRAPDASTAPIVTGDGAPPTPP